MVRIVEVRERDIRESPPPVEGDYELVAIDVKGVGYDVTELLKESDEAESGR
ncbi:MAG: hypothetical protein NZ733_06455 [Aigarchaeota archaeon]|nr:hypothetical protein [Aigarchaeota archaeon]MCS7118374.1 hypothetical protein [Candidatus Calditenuaceae archaeon]MDW8042568.1 hypothetical protein [Nitrososphaerota archaeon]